MIGDVSSFLQSVTDRLKEDSTTTLLVASEIEFYLIFTEEAQEAALLFAIHQACSLLPLTVGEVEKERGRGQYEIQLSPTADPLILADTIRDARYFIAETALKHQAQAVFASKPYADEPGSSIHIHVNMFDREGVNLFQKIGENDPPLLLHAIGGLCATLREAMAIFAPTAASYARFQKNSNAPTTISWGGNNRTTALRIPLSPPENRRIEHRVAGSESNPHLVIAAILAGIHYGITNHIPAPTKIYGDASHPQYGLEALPGTLEEAVRAYEEGRVIGPALDFFHLAQ